MSEHTKTPWHATIGMPPLPHPIYSEAARLVAHVGTKEDALFIERACNAHDDLLEACEHGRARLLLMYANYGVEMDEKTPPILSMMDAAIAKAKQ